MRISDRVVLITGASGGIGLACAHEFRKRGAKLALVARQKERLEQAVAPGDLVIPADLTDSGTRAQLIEQCIRHFGRLDILINNAGLGLSAPSWRADMRDVRYLFELNVFAPLELAQLAAPHMRSQGSGMIVNIGSVAGKITMPWFSVYSATKFALGSLTGGLRMELERAGIHAMIVCPGFVSTDFHKHVLGGPPRGAERRGRPGQVTPQQCATAIADGVERNARTIVVPRKAWLLVAASRLFPATVDRLLARSLENEA